MNRGSLYSLHSIGGVTLQESDGWIVPAAFSTPDRELEILKTSVGLVDLSGWGVLRLSGEDRLAFVHRMSTNDVINLEPGHGLPTIFTTPIGRIVDLAFAFVRQQDLLLLVGRGADDVIAAWLKRHIFFNDDVHVERITSQVALMGLHGPDAMRFLSQLGKAGATDLKPFSMWSDTIAGKEATAIRSAPLGFKSLLMVNEEDGPELWSNLSAAVVSFGGAPVGELAIEAARIASGIPRFGRELSEDYIPLEAGLRWAISFNKGCYVGQEIIARMDTHQRLSKRLVILAGDEPAARVTEQGSDRGSWLKADTKICVDGVQVGRLTSVSPIAEKGSRSALAYIKTALAKPGQRVDAVSDTKKMRMCVSSVPDAR